MALELTDFGKASTLSLEDIRNSLPVGGSINARSASLLAAKQTLLTEPSVEQYDKAKTELLNPESRKDFIVREEALRETIYQDATQSLVSSLSDSNLSDEKKTALYTGYTNITTSKLPPMSSNDALAEQALIADSGQETGEAESTRSLLVESVRKVNESKRNLTRMINELEIGKDAGVASKFVDVLETIVPLAEYAHVTNMLEEIDPNSPSGVMLGTRKANLYNQISKMSVDQRAAFADKVIALVQDHENIVLPDGNDLLALETLQRMLVDNDYSDFEMWFDNATSVLDAIGVGAFIRVMAKGPKSAVLAGKLGKLAKGAKALARPGAKIEMKAAGGARAEERLTQEAAAFKAEQPPTDVTLQSEADNFAATPENLGPAGEKLQDEAMSFQLDKTRETESAKELAREAMAWLARTDVSPTSPSQIFKDVNPEMARAAHETVLNDETGEAAKALYGTTKEDALAKDILPEPELNPGVMPHKVEMAPKFEEPENIRATRKADGNIILNDNELSRLKNKITEGISNVEGMVLHPSSLVIRNNLDGSIGYTARYSPVDSGFATPERAIQSAQFAFRKYGMQRENFSLLARRGDKWEEVTEAELSAERALRGAGAEINKPDANEFAIGMKYDYRVSPEDLEDVDFLTTAPGYIARVIQYADRIPTQIMSRMGQGSLVQHLLDSASVIHPQIIGAASVGVDKAVALKKFYVDEFADFSKVYGELKPTRRALMTDYIHQANLEGLPFNTTDLFARGFNEKEVGALKKWRQANDAMWYAANDDMVSTLKAQGIKVFFHEGTDTKLMGRPLGRGAVSASDEVYDAAENSVRGVSKDELDQLYEQKGEIVRLAEPIEIDGRTIDLVLSRNTPDAGYVRALYDGERVLAYRDGYYPVMYDANFFITKKAIGVDGKEYTRVVGSARNREEVKQALDGIKASEGLSDEEFNSVYSFRKDRRLENSSNSLFDEGSWGVSTNAGLTSQRVRGQRLGDAGANLQNMGSAHLLDPLEAVTNQIQQLSRKISMRRYFDTAKKRWMLQYGDYLDLPRNTKTGRIDIPTNISMIKGKTNAPAKIVADARTNYNYISSLENGFINGIDAGYKAVANLAADFLGEKGFGKLEEALLNTSKVSPIQASKTAAFKLFISGNPLRQGLIQRAQMLMVGALNGKYFAKDMVKDLVSLNAVRYSGSKNPKYMALLEEVKTSGVLEAVDANTLVRDDMLRMADLTMAQKAATVAGTPLRWAQKIGFDAAEQDVLLSTWLAQRDKAVKAGLNVADQRVKDQILADTRAFTLQMNRAGEMPYSQNTLGLVAQFFSFRHKALLQGLSNRNLSVLERGKLLAYTTALFGVEATLVSAAVNSLFEGEEPSEFKDKLEAGLLDTTLNAALTMASGEAQQIDFGDFAPTEAYGTFNVFAAMLNTPLAEVVAEAPAGSLLFGANPRVSEMFKTGFKFFVPSQNYEDEQLKVGATDVIVSAASLFSGFSNYFKARYAAKTGQKISGNGRVTDADVTKVEAAFTAFGFQTRTETGYRKLNEETLSGTKFEQSDVIKWYAELKRVLARRGMTVEESGLQRNILSEAWRVFGEDRPRAIKSILSSIENDAKNQDYTVLKGLMNQMGIIPNEDLWKLINTLPAGKVRDRATEMLKAREEMSNGG